MIFPYTPKMIQISKYPVTIEEIPAGAARVHESVMRSYHILESVKEYLKLDTPPSVILEMIEVMEHEPMVESENE